MKDKGVVVDFVVFQNIIYAVTLKANIGVLSLDSPNIKFLKLNSTPNEIYYYNLRLVICDEQLLVVNVRHRQIKKVFKIEGSTMNYVKLKILGDIALFYDADNFRVVLVLQDLSKSFAMKNFGYAKKILGMRITCEL
ncbi:hypothetical protein MTR_1g093300 [Medicago truncatula]|uniref:KIB1-4 beta-propeller domain-containing protein n=1 Tax=Medicago truncatula TaxID=3880 RepID=G7I481_MEDTR|nr:hypothetical protein MTR_1g093300 [Medicago truncatula]